MISLDKLTQGELQHIYEVVSHNTPHQFGYKSFWYGDFEYIPSLDIHVRIGQSYSTIVTIEVSKFIGGEFIDVLYECGKFSTTTSRQVTQFFNQLSHAKTRVLMEELIQ